MNGFNERDYRDIIKAEYARRCQRNRSYSLRAFARDLGVTYSRVNEAMNGKRGLSAELASRIAEKIGLSTEESEAFVLQVESQHARSRLARERARTALAEAREKLAAAKVPSQATMQLDVFEMISHWCHYAILELTALEDFESDIDWIAQRLRISRVEAELAVARLERIGLLGRDPMGRLQASEQFTISPSGIPSDGLKRHHEQMLEKAKDAVYFQSVDERDLSAITLSIDSRDLPKAKALIKKLRHEFAESMMASPRKDRVYSLAIQFFRLDTGPRKKTRNSKKSNEERESS